MATSARFGAVPTNGERIGFTNGRLEVPSTPVIPFIEGDGTGPDIWRAAQRVLDAAVERAYGGERRIAWMEVLAGEKSFHATQDWLPQETLDALGEFRVSIKGPLSTPVGGGIRSLNVALRQVLDLYACIRPVRYFEGVGAPVREPQKLDIVIFRENTEGLYAGIGGAFKRGLPDEITIASEINTRRGVERIIRYAFHWARENGREHVTMADKANAIPAHMLWRRLFDEIGKEEFPDIQRETRYIDAMAMELVRNPEQFQVIVTGNLFGDILSDLASAIVGGLGLAPSANRHPGFVSMFEPVHGSAPTLAKKDIANPMAAILSMGMMLRTVGSPEAALMVERAIRAAIVEDRVTRDLGGDYTTREVGDWIAEWIRTA